MALPLKEEEMLGQALSALARLWLVQLWHEGEAGDLVAQVAAVLGTPPGQAEASQRAPTQREGRRPEAARCGTLAGPP